MADEQTVLIYNKNGEPHQVPKSLATPDKMAKFQYSFEPPTSSKPMDSDIHQTANPDYQASGSIETMGQPQQDNNDQLVQQMQQQFSPSLSESIAKRPDLQKTIDALKPVAKGAGDFIVGTALSGADAILGNAASVANLAPDTINLLAGTNIPRMEGTNFKQYTPEGMMGQAGNVVGDVAGNVVGGGAAFKALGAVPKLGNEASILANSLRGGAAGYATGAENPGGRYAGAAEGGVAGPALKMTNKSLADTLLNQYEKIKSGASKEYSNLFQKAGNDLAIPSSKENLDYEMIKSSFTKADRKNIDKYFEDPTLQNAHKAQSDLGKKIRTLEKGKQDPNFLGNSKIDALTQAREAIKNGMNKTLDNRLPGGSSEYQQISQKYAEQVAPYKELKVLESYKKGEKTPKQVLSKIDEKFKNSKPGKDNSMLKSRESINKALGSKPAKWALDASKIAVGTSPFAYGEYKGYKNSNDQ